jgi:hypothetical protein
MKSLIVYATLIIALLTGSTFTSANVDIEPVFHVEESSRFCWNDGYELWQLDGSTKCECKEGFTGVHCRQIVL